jgi:hypothetical protein
MEKKPDFSPSQNLVWRIICVGSMIGIYIFLGTQTDVKDPFVIGVYFFTCAVVAWGSRRFVAANVDESGKYRPKSKH